MSARRPHGPVGPIGLLALVVAAAAVLVGCTTVVDGAGRTVPTGFPSSRTPSNGPSGPSSSPTSPSSSPGGPAAHVDFRCPTVSYPYAGLRFRCVMRHMQRLPQDPIWPLSLGHVVEKRTGWAVSAGAGHYGAQNGKSLGTITRYVRAEMIKAHEYGTSPTVHTVRADRQRIHGAQAFVLQSTIRLSSRYRKKVHTRVRIEKQWILAVEISPRDWSLWFVSVPDVVRSLWPTVRRDIASIRVH